MEPLVKYPLQISIFFIFCTLFASAQEISRKRIEANWYAAQKIAKPSQSLKVSGNTIYLYGRQIELDKNGFPKQIRTFFNQTVTSLTDTANLLLAENIHFHFVRKEDGRNIKFDDQGFAFVQQTTRMVNWKAKSSSDSLLVEVDGKLTATGFLNYTVKVTALKDVQLKEVTMHIPFQKNGAKLMSGLGIAGGLRPDRVEWKWDMLIGDQDIIWLGNTNAGLQYRLLTAKAKSSSVNQSANSWSNEGKGGIIVGIKGSSMLANNFTGEHQMAKGEVRYYNFNLLVTPSIIDK